MWCKITLILVVLIVLIVVLIDFFPQFYTWQSRIHIGRYSNREDWKKKISAITSHWLLKTPTIKLTDNSRLIIIDILRGNYSRNAIQHWQQASLLLGLIEQYKTEKKESTKVIISAFLDAKMKADGNWKNAPTEIDGVILAYAIFSIPWLDHNKYKPAFEAIYNLVLNLKGEDGTVAYKKYNTDYRFVDTIGFICPFLVHYGLHFNQPEAVELAVKQIKTYDDYGMLSQNSIPCHTYNVKNKIPVGLFGWGRGLGWYAIGLIDSWSALPETHQLKKELSESVVQFAKMAASFQNENGSYNWLILDKLARQDSSATATLAWFFSKATSINEIQIISEKASEKALDYLQSVTRRDGVVDFSQGDTKAIGIYARDFDRLPFTQGFVLRTLYHQ